MYLPKIFYETYGWVYPRKSVIRVFLVLERLWEVPYFLNSNDDTRIFPILVWLQMIESVGSKNGIWENTSIGDLFLEEGEGRSFEAGEEIPESSSVRSH